MDMGYTWDGALRMDLGGCIFGMYDIPELHIVIE